MYQIVTTVIQFCNGSSASNRNPSDERAGYSSDLRVQARGVTEGLMRTDTRIRMRTLHGAQDANS